MKAASSRNDLLKKALKVYRGKASDARATVPGERDDSLAYDLYSSVDYMATAVTAAKLRSPYRIPDQFARCLAASNYEVSGAQSLGKPVTKYYIERLRVSATKAEISGSGFFPIASTHAQLRHSGCFIGSSIRCFSTPSKAGLVRS